MKDSVSMSSHDLDIHAKVEFRKAIGHLHAGMEYLQWLNYYGAPDRDAEYEEKIRGMIDAFIENLEEAIG
jgi:hypothetical protein